MFSELISWKPKTPAENMVHLYLNKQKALRFTGQQQLASSRVATGICCQAWQQFAYSSIETTKKSLFSWLIKASLKACWLQMIAGKISGVNVPEKKEQQLNRVPHPENNKSTSFFRLFYQNSQFPYDPIPSWVCRAGTSVCVCVEMYQRRASTSVRVKNVTWVGCHHRKPHQHQSPPHGDTPSLLSSGGARARGAGLSNNHH